MTEQGQQHSVETFGMLVSELAALSATRADDGTFQSENGHSGILLMPAVAAGGSGYLVGSRKSHIATGDVMDGYELSTSQNKDEFLIVCLLCTM